MSARRASLDAALELPVVKAINRVLSDYPAAREMLCAHRGKTIETFIGPVSVRMRIDGSGSVELMGAGEENSAPSSSSVDVTLRIPLALLPRLARRDDSAYASVEFKGDSELASTLSTIARHVNWDFEEDLSRWIGDAAANRVGSGARALRTWGIDASTRVTANFAEYLTEEKRAFATLRELEQLAMANEELRDDIARFEARLRQFQSAPR
jgi:ubiquinone biosynthesis accessory factor UbiJ